MIDESALDRPWDVLMGALIAKAEGRESDVDEDSVVGASMLLVGGTFVQAGLSVEAVEHLLIDRDFTIKLAYRPDEDTVSLALDWSNEVSQDGYCWRCDATPATTEIGLCDPCKVALTQEPS